MFQEIAVCEVYASTIDLLGFFRVDRESRHSVFMRNYFTHILKNLRIHTKIIQKNNSIFDLFSASILASFLRHFGISKSTKKRTIISHNFSMDFNSRFHPKCLENEALKDHKSLQKPSKNH